MPAKADRTVGNYTTLIQGDIEAEWTMGMDNVIAGKANVKDVLNDLQARMSELLNPFVR